MEQNRKIVDFQKDVEDLRKKKKDLKKSFVIKMFSIGSLFLSMLSVYIGYYLKYGKTDISNFIILVFCFMVYLISDIYGYRNTKSLYDLIITDFELLDKQIRGNYLTAMIFYPDLYKTVYPAKSVENNVITLNKPLEFSTKDELLKLKEQMLEFNEFEFVKILDEHIAKFK